jgi:lysophospholipid acyltransferase (LPLAT)-like uncharacterized protein
MIFAMTFRERLRWRFVGVFGKAIIWLWSKSTRMKIVGDADYLAFRKAKKPVIFLVWHGKIFIVPYFFRRRGIMPLISPSRDGEIPARIMDGWGYKILRGSGSHVVKEAWLEMKKELQSGGEVIIVPDGPRGPDRKLKLGCIKLAAETGAALVPFSFSTSRKKDLKSWDRFLMFYPFSKVVAVYGKPLEIRPGLTDEEMETERQRIETLMVEFDRNVDDFFAQ